MRLAFTVALLASTVFAAVPALGQEQPAESQAVALADVPRGLLSDAAIPTAYRIDTSFDPARDGFSGRTEIDVELAAPSRFIDLHGRNLDMLSVVARPAGGGADRWTGTWHQIDDSGVARIGFPEDLPAGRLTLEFAYTGRYQNNASGLFHVKVGDEWYGWSQFQSTDARAAFPSFDQPSFKVPFTVTIRTPAGQVAVSNAPEVSSTLEDGWQVHRFAPTLPLPTYLVAMMAGPFVTAESVVPPTPERAQPLPLRIVTTRPNAGTMHFALENSKPIVALLENYFGQAFPYPKLDQITSPVMPGAMENAGADLYADGILILDEDAAVSRKKLFGMVVAHELAHQWFGDLVTPRWWDDIWLNESFANWMGYEIGGRWRPDLKIGEGALAEGFEAMSTDELAAGRPIHQPIATNDQVDSAFDTITYGKGGHVVAMVAGFVGPDAFRQGVRAYMGAHRYGTATSEDFFAAMASAAKDDRLTQAMQSFTDQQGVPLITVSGGDGSYSIRQSRYAPLGAEPTDTRWGVPVCMRRSEERACTLLADAAGAFALAGSGPLMPNAGGTGYYRFELPGAEWDALIAQADTLEAAEALALEDSLDASFRAGRASPSKLIALAERLAANPDSYAAGAATDSLARLYRAGFLDDAAEAAYLKWAAGLVRKDYEALGFDPKAGAYAGADPEETQRRQRAVAGVAMARDPALEKTLVAAVGAYLGGETAALDPAFFGTAMKAYLAKTGIAGARTLASAALASEDPVFRPAALSAIGRSGDPEVARWILAGIEDGRLRVSEQLSLRLAVVLTGKTRDLGYDWMRGNLAALIDGKSGIFNLRGIPMVLRDYCSVSKANEIAELFRGNLAGTPAALELERTIEQVRNCGTLKAARAQEVNAALRALQ
ncbi:M1 family metallopeptidase [Tsuneonella sp. YG55]|uniref:Aminopeptidase n=1 Tax=Tsuneonella litorea TaxID=2976475 RepID=A0A9X2VYW2_9SPHN|nr:M1 family metallopeptidase [Tsuneonella litorea]MCT2557676.1 M1 family metallopeptidase [Tsuneonella litorea]